MFSKLIRNAVHKIYLYKKQDHLGNRNKMRRAMGKLEATLLTTGYLVSISTVKLQDARQQITSQSWLRCSKSRIWTSSARNHNNYSSTGTTQRLSNLARILQNINVLIAMPSPKSGSFIAVSTHGVLQHSRRPIAILLQSLTLSLRRIPVEDQNMMPPKDRWCFSRRRRCYKRNMAAIRRCFQGGTNKKDTESHWRSTISAKRKSCFSIGSLLKDTTFQPRELSGCRTPNIGFFVWMLMGLKSLFDSDQNLPLH